MNHRPILTFYAVAALCAGGLYAGALACTNPTAPEPAIAKCSVFYPAEGVRLTTFCYTPCPPGTAKWAAGATMGYAVNC